MNIKKQQNYLIELEKLNSRELDRSYDGGLGVMRFKVETINNSIEYLEKAKDILKIIDKKIVNSEIMPNLEEWKQILPNEFINKFAKEMTQEEANEWLKKWQSLSMEDRIKEEQNRKWTFSNWVYWFEPDNKNWFWLKDEIINNNEFWFEVEVDEIPTPKDALLWLFKALGVSNIEQVED